MQAAQDLFRRARAGAPEAFVARMTAWLAERDITLETLP